MSWQKSLLNPLLRLMEKRQMANAKRPSSLRRAFEFKAKILFQAPRCAPKLLAISAHSQRAVARAAGSVGHIAMVGRCSAKVSAIARLSPTTVPSGILSVGTSLAGARWAMSAAIVSP